MRKSILAERIEHFKAQDWQKYMAKLQESQEMFKHINRQETMFALEIVKIDPKQFMEQLTMIKKDPETNA